MTYKEQIDKVRDCIQYADSKYTPDEWTRISLWRCYMKERRLGFGPVVSIEMALDKLLFGTLFIN